MKLYCIIQQPISKEHYLFAACRAFRHFKKLSKEKINDEVRDRLMCFGSEFYFEPNWKTIYAAEMKSAIEYVNEKFTNDKNKGSNYGA